MLEPRIIPVLLLKGEGLVKGVRFKGHKYVGDPINAVKIFADKEVDELLFLDVTATDENRSVSPDLVQRIADESYMPFGVGGGVRSVELIRALLGAGAEKVSINTAAIEQPALISEAATVFGTQSIIVGIDVKSSWLGAYKVHSHCGARATGLDPVAWAREVERRGAGEILLNSIDRDGTAEGYDLTLIRKISEAVTIPVIACGGAGTTRHLEDAIHVGGAAAAAAGSFFVFHGPKRAVLISFPRSEEARAIRAGPGAEKTARPAED